jgi:hypothetical protein
MIIIIIIYSNMKNKLFSFKVIFTLLFLIMSALFLIYIFRNRENFDSQNNQNYSWKYGQEIKCKGILNTNTELQQLNSYFNKEEENYNRYNKSEYNRINIQSTTHPYTSYCDIMNYNDLLAYKCLKISPQELSVHMDSSDIANIFETIYIYNENSLYSYLLTKIQTNKNSINGKIKGPVYVCISQAPYLKYSSDLSDVINKPYSKYLDARIDILNNKKPYYSELISSDGEQKIKIEANDGEDPSTIISSLYAQILIIFPLYTKKMELKIDNEEETINTFLNTTMKKYYTHNDLCFIKCNKSSTINCGCLNMNSESTTSSINTYHGTSGNTERDYPRYKSKCIDHTNNNNPQPFSMMYFVNPYSDNYENVIEDPIPQSNNDDTKFTGEVVDIYEGNYEDYYGTRTI